MTSRLLLLATACMALVGCAHEGITDPDGPGGAVIAIDVTGVVFTPQGRDLWIREGVPAAWFTPAGRNWHITDLLWHQGNLIRLNRSNK